MRRGLPILWKLLGATLLPALLAFFAFGFMAHRAARRALEDELGRRLVAAAQTAALAIRAERVDLLQPGDEDSRTSRNVRRKLLELQQAAGAARVYAFDAGRGSRADTDEGIAIGHRYLALASNAPEIDRALAGSATASVLYTGRDGAEYKSGYAPLRDELGATVGVVGVDGAAPLYEQLESLRRTLFAFGLGGLLVVLLLSVLVARRITQPVRALEAAARRIGGGDLESVVNVRSHDEVGFLARTLDEMRQGLRARDERLQMMLAGIAHEVRNPLAGMELYAGILRDELDRPDDEERRSQVRRIERELAHLRAIVTEFLDYARRPRPELRTIDVTAIAREVRELLAAEASGRPVSVRLEAGAPVYVEGDLDQLRRALTNLGRNALQALGDAGGAVTITTATDGERARIDVRDDGPGIAPEHREKLFVPFFTTREKGTGLGLAFVSEIARDHGGSVEVESKLGEGARFSIVLPGVVPRVVPGVLPGVIPGSAARAASTPQNPRSSGE